jgi:GAF domain-containing protein/transcriptional regulator with XRE-family HTH domain/energy-coupling factor transporter ATP-binding protein EcfA2
MRWTGHTMSSNSPFHVIHNGSPMNISSTSSTPLSFGNFGEMLKFLRRRARLTQLELSITVGYSEAQISRLEKNLRLPHLTALKALFIPALRLEHEPQLTACFLELAQSARQEDAPAVGLPPYKGLLHFDESDAELFFGREALTAQLAEHVMDLIRDASTRFLAVVGASGSGKSSLVRAGLAVILKRAGWDTRIFTPTSQPLNIAQSYLRSLPTSPAERMLIIVDQFEEVFTLCHDEVQRIAFVEKLMEAAQDKSRHTTVVVALRADFYSHCAQYPRLRQAVATEQEYIGQMSSEELRHAIEGPAKLCGWEFEPGLVDILLNDVRTHGASEPEPGALPLLSHALLATWERRSGHTLTLNGYQASGGVRGAIAETAESVFNDQLDQEQQEIARDVFLRLTELGEGTEDTRRRAALNELVHKSAAAIELRSVLNTLAEARLITLNEDSAEVGHEALIREWQRLREWLHQDREGLRLHRHLTAAAQDWEILGRDAGALYRGTHLAQAREWVALHPEALNQGEHSFLNASIEQERREAEEHEAQYQRDLDNARKLAELERQRAEMEGQRAAELQIINSVQEALASKLEMQAIYDLVGDKVREIFNAQGTAIFIFDHETEIAHAPYCFLEERFAADSAPFSGVAKQIINTAQPVEFRTNEEYISLGGYRVVGVGQKHQSGMYVPLMIGKTVKGMVGISNLHKEYAYNDSDVRLLQTLAHSMSVALENARLFDETQRLLKETEQRAAELAMINSIQQALASKLDIQGIYELIGNKLSELFHVEGVLILAYDPQTSQTSARYCLERGNRFRFEPGPVSSTLRHLILTHKSLLINDNMAARLSELNIEFAVYPGTDAAKSILYVPLIVGDEVTGTISLQSIERENAFSESDMRLLERFASSMSVALENVRLFNETQRLLKEAEQRAAELQIINSVQEGLASKLEMQAIYDLVGDKIKEITGSGIVLISVYDLEKGMRYDKYSREKDERFPISEHSFTSLEKSIMPDLQHAKAILWNEGMEERVRKLGHSHIVVGELPLSVVVVPLKTSKTDPKNITVISLQNGSREYAFGESDVRLVETLANSMSVALENARLFHETQRLLKEAQQHAEEQARTTEQLRKRFLYLAAAFVVVFMMALIVLYFGL